MEEKKISKKKKGCRNEDEEGVDRGGFYFK